MRGWMSFCWSFLERLHTLEFATGLSALANLDGQTLLLLATLAVALMTYRKVDQRDGRPRRRPRRKTR